MTKILAVGAVMPEFVSDRRLAAASYRMEQLISPLIQDGHEVTVCGANLYDSVPGVRCFNKGKLAHYQIDCEIKPFIKKVQLIHGEFKPDCIIGISRYGANVAAALKSNAPMWIDLFGSPMCEAQSKSYVYDDDRWISEFWKDDQICLIRGDVFSTCSKFQEHFLTGQLSSLGRLNKSTFGYRFAYGVPPGISSDTAIRERGEKLLRGHWLDEADFAVLWCGGYNVWTDIDTLFAVLEKAFSENDRIKFVSIGGRVDYHDDITYPRFERMVARSKYRDRFKLLGWRSYADAVKAYSECDLGISIDKYHYEPVYGTRTRIVEMIQYHLPVITSLACELSYVLKDNSLALTFDIGNSSELSEQIVKFSREPIFGRAALADKAYSFFLKNFTYEKTTKPLRRWVRRPVCAPDSNLTSRPNLILHSDIEYFRDFFEEHPEDNISLKRLLKNKLKLKLGKLLRSLSLR